MAVTASAAEYQIKVYTGHLQDASTNANVFVTLIGTAGATPEIPLTASRASNRNPFERGQCDVWEVTQCDIGDAQRIRIRQDGKGYNASWFISHVELLKRPPRLHTDSSRASAGYESEHVFPVYEWLSQQKGLQREFVCATPLDRCLWHPERSKLTCGTAKYSVASFNENQQVTTSRVLISIYGHLGAIECHRVYLGRDRYKEESFEGTDVGIVTKVVVKIEPKGKNPEWRLSHLWLGKQPLPDPEPKNTGLIEAFRSAFVKPRAKQNAGCVEERRYLLTVHDMLSEDKLELAMVPYLTPEQQESWTSSPVYAVGRNSMPTCVPNAGTSYGQQPGAQTFGAVPTSPQQQGMAGVYHAGAMPTSAPGAVSYLQQPGPANSWATSSPYTYPPDQAAVTAMPCFPPQGHDLQYSTAIGHPVHNPDPCPPPHRLIETPTGQPGANEGEDAQTHYAQMWGSNSMRQPAGIQHDIGSNSSQQYCTGAQDALATVRYNTPGADAAAQDELPTVRYNTPVADAAAATQLSQQATAQQYRAESECVAPEQQQAGQQQPEPAMQAPTGNVASEPCARNQPAAEVPPRQVGSASAVSGRADLDSNPGGPETQLGRRSGNQFHSLPDRADSDPSGHSLPHTQAISAPAGNTTIEADEAPGLREPQESRQLQAVESFKKQLENPGKSCTRTPGGHELNPKDLLILKQLGEGSYGTVCQAKWHGTYVAVKLFGGVNGEKWTERDVEAFWKETEVVAKLQDHENVVRTKGFIQQPPCIIMEYCSMGSVFDLLRKAREGDTATRNRLTWPKMLRMAVDAACGMMHCHSNNPPIIHRDVKSPNLLVNEHMRVKVSDFGLSRDLKPGTTSAKSMMEINATWAAPEVLNDLQYSMKSDVFSFGIVMWELLTWRQPWEDKHQFQIITLVQDGQRPAIPPMSELEAMYPSPGPTMHEYMALMRRCWDALPERRPDFEVIHKELEVMYQAALAAPKRRAAEAERARANAAPAAVVPQPPGGARVGPGAQPPQRQQLQPPPVIALQPQAAVAAGMAVQPQQRGQMYQQPPMQNVGGPMRAGGTGSGGPPPIFGLQPQGPTQGGPPQPGPGSNPTSTSHPALPSFSVTFYPGPISDTPITLSDIRRSNQQQQRPGQQQQQQQPQQQPQRNSSGGMHPFDNNHMTGSAPSPGPVNSPTYPSITHDYNGPINSHVTGSSAPGSHPWSQQPTNAPSQGSIGSNGQTFFGQNPHHTNSLPNGTYTQQPALGGPGPMYQQQQQQQQPRPTYQPSGPSYGAVPQYQTQQQQAQGGYAPYRAGQPGGYGQPTQGAVGGNSTSYGPPQASYLISGLSAPPGYPTNGQPTGYTANGAPPGYPTGGGQAYPQNYGLGAQQQQQQQPQQQPQQPMRYGPPPPETMYGTPQAQQQLTGNFRDMERRHTHPGR